MSAKMTILSRSAATAEAFFDNGSLAQLVEHRTFNPLVPRSSRGRPTIQNVYR